MSFGTNIAGPPENAAKFSSELPAESVLDGWKPRHFHEVVAVSMVIRQWMKPRDRTRERLSAETDFAVREVNASLVFEPMPVTLERVRALQQRRQAPSADHQDQAVHVAKPSLQQMDNSMPMTGHLSNGRAIGSTEVAEPAPPEEAEGVFLGHMRKTRTKLIDWGTKAALLPQTAVDPTGLFYCYWTLLVYAVFLYNALACVLFVFDDTQKDQQVFTRWTTLNVFGDFINLADLFINLRLSYLEDGLTVDNLIRLAKPDALKQACDMWWAELKQYGFQSSLVLDMNQFNKGIGHWSQQGWANTAQLGCAMARCPSSTWKTWVVCNYNASGNYLNQVVYKKGTACSGCSEYSGASCNSTSGLCILP
uniref:SCP domain-containing protein n=1 Tax=Globodera pallida TaxID=36090 RepID=A0A183CET9_GLOPA